VDIPGASGGYAPGYALELPVVILMGIMDIPVASRGDGPVLLGVLYGSGVAQYVATSAQQSPVLGEGKSRLFVSSFACLLAVTHCNITVTPV
jgi:hypothetical protein